MIPAITAQNLIQKTQKRHVIICDSSPLWNREKKKRHANVHTDADWKQWRTAPLTFGQWASSSSPGRGALDSGKDDLLASLSLVSPQTVQCSARSARGARKQSPLDGRHQHPQKHKAHFVRMHSSSHFFLSRSTHTSLQPDTIRA